ncbi:MAG: GrpB family protein [Anaerolineae bacterium]|nr:GrpB family protein [Anaerolineae bacterium]
MSDPIIVVPYDPAWPVLFDELGGRLRLVLGNAALRIDHVGSTSVPGLAAKPVIDIQISVASFEPLDAYRLPLEVAGFAWRPDNPDLTKRYFREMPGRWRTHVHVQRAGSLGEQLTLVFRDYLRAHLDDARHYAELKYRLAEEYRDDRGNYTDSKGPFIWQILRKATRWSQDTGWQPGPSDA